MRLRFGEAWEGIFDLRNRVEVYFEPRDLWVGVYIEKKGPIYICLLPCVVIRISRGRRKP